MDATTEHPAHGPARLAVRGCALALAIGLLTSCGGEDDPGGGSTPGATTSDAMTSDAMTSDAMTSDGMTSEATTSEDADESASGTTSGDAGDDEAAADVVIVIADFAYEVPDSVAPGATITVRNEDSVGHTVTSDDETTFDVSVGPGEEVTMTAPEEAGEFPFFCRPHPNMRGTLVVEEG